MWSSRIAFDSMRQRDKWRVEAFSGLPSTTPTAAHPFCSIGDLVRERRESLDPQAYPDHVFNYIGLENVASLTGDLVNFAPVPGTSIRSKSKVFRESDVLFGRLRPYLNKVFLAAGPVSCGICSGEFFVLSANSSLMKPRVLRALLASDYVMHFVASLQSGTALPRVDVEELFRIQVPVPPLEDQEEYERFLEEQSRRLHGLTAEMNWLPSAMFEALHRALASGDPPASPTVEIQPEPIYDHALPVAFKQEPQLSLL